MVEKKPNHDFKEGFTRELWSHKELAAGLGLSRGHLYRLLEQGQMLPPDVIVLPDSFGWEPTRAKRFGTDTDRLDADGNPIGPAPDGSLDKAATLVRTRYAKRPDVYLSSWYCSYVYDFNASTVYFVRSRGNFMPADVLIGKSKYGWSESRVIEIGEQTGRLDDEKIDSWLVRRTGEHGMSPAADWVKERVQARPHLAKPLERATEAFRAAQENASA